MIEEALINFKPETDFEKLLFANNQIKDLKKELKETKIKLGILQSEKDELNSLLSDTKTGLQKYQNLKEQNAKKDTTIRDLKKSNRELVQKLVKYQINEAEPKKE